MKQIELNIKSGLKVEGEIWVPGSKSITNRALLVSSLSRKRVDLKGALWSDDTLHMIQGLKQLGVEVRWYGKNHCEVMGQNIASGGIAKNIYAGNAGTVVRFLTMLCSVCSVEVILDGSERMRQRPMKGLVDPILELGGKIEYIGKEGYPPLRVRRGFLEGGQVKMRGDISSQYLSSVLLSGSYTKKGVGIQVEGKLVSKPYIDVTKKVMEDFGVEIKQEGYEFFKVSGGQKYARREYQIEGDATSASYFWAMAAVTGGKVRVWNIDDSSKQGDIRFVNLLQAMGCRVRRGLRYIEVEGKARKGIDVAMEDISDVVPTLCVVALFVDGVTRIRNIGHIQLKETDRLRALSEELKKIGAIVQENNDGLIIQPMVHKYQGVEVKTYQDHRLGMAFAVASLKIAGLKIMDPDCVAKTFPNYFSCFKKLCQI